MLIPDEEKRAEFVEVLKYKEGKLGRVLTKKISGLPAGSRLEPSPNLPDVADFEVALCPFQARFFVGSDRSRWLHNCPLFEVIPNFTFDSWGIDLLHTWCLGPLAGFVGLCLRTSGEKSVPAGGQRPPGKRCCQSRAWESQGSHVRFL